MEDKSGGCKFSQMSKKETADNKKFHNKSGKEGLSFLEKGDDKKLQSIYVLHMERIDSSGGRSISGLIYGSDCILYGNEKGSLSINGDHFCYGYQLVAWKKFGRGGLQGLRASKRADDLVISHLCGTRNCLNPQHLVLESKRVNDERTHCHFVMMNILATTGFDGIERFYQVGGCKHFPKCGTLVSKYHIKY